MIKCTLARITKASNLLTSCTKTKRIPLPKYPYSLTAFKEPFSWQRNVYQLERKFYLLVFELPKLHNCLSLILFTYMILTILSVNRLLDSPILGLQDIEDNKVLTVRYRDPKYPDDFIFEAKRLPKAIDPPTVLAPEHRASNYRPQVGFNRNFPQASLGDAGHRMVNHYSGGNNSNDNRNYASIAPPQNYRGE